MLRPLSVIAALTLTTSLAAQPGDSTWRQHNAAAEAAIARHDWPDARRHLLQVDRALNGHPAVTLALARVAARSGDTTEALALVRAYADMGLGRDALADSAFDAVRDRAAWAALAERLRANRRPVGAADTAFVLADSAFLPEDIAYDAPRRRFLVSSIRRRRIVAVDPTGHIRDFVAQGAEIPWGVLGLAIDARRGRVWATTEAIPQAEGHAPADSGRAAVLRFDMEGRLLERLDLPRDGARHEPGDIGVAPNGDLFVSDGRAGVMYVVRERGHDRHALEPFVTAGTFVSPQGPAVSPDGRVVYVADYAKGVARVDPRTGAVAWLTHERPVALVGIDGLTARRAADGTTTLVAVQNGVTPNRVVALSLDATGSAVRAWRTLLQDPAVVTEPTHGAMVGDTLYVIANSNFGAFGDGVAPPREPLVPSRVLRVALP